MENNKQCSGLNLERVRALETWLEQTNTRLVQVNGQRKYGGPPAAWKGPAPGAHCEVFISQIPRETYEDVLIPLFSSVGPLWEFRLMMNFSGQNRGFAYAKYGSATVAGEAIRMLHGYMLETSSPLCVRRSTEKRHLTIGNLPTSTTSDQLLQVLHTLAEGVERVVFRPPEPGTKGLSAIVAFSSHYTASMAKKVLVEDFQKRFSLTITIGWQSMERHSSNGSKAPPKYVPSVPTPLQHSPSSKPATALHPFTPQVFCRAVGGPAVHSSLQRHQLFTSNPVKLLRRVCKEAGVGRPRYEMLFSHTGPNGFLHFTYTVLISGISSPFAGQVMILPGPNVGAVLEEAQRVAAQQVLHKVHNY
ncbi:dead end protein 1 [Gouania willdenowi]|uniref:RRM domain-containing protein n=1 Tax=Gouania willdenowi TaxID=441366 RepID=A0A8C5N727_GOUWI|nr:dead end protein homolog 1 [Gouania willdenowi]